MGRRGWFSNFSLFWTGQLVSQLGDAVYHIGLVWLALEKTQSKMLSSLVVSAGYLPAIVFSLFAGVLVDRVDRRRLMMACAAAQAAVVALVPLLEGVGWLGPGTLALIAFGLAAGGAFFNPARDALIPHLVNRENLNRANSFVQVSAQIAYLAGPAAAGVLVTLVGLTGLFSLDALTFLFVVAALGFIDLPRAGQPHLRPGPSPLPQLPQPAASTTDDIRAGLRHAWHDARLRGLLFVTAIDNLIIMGPAIFGTPVYVREVLGLGPSFYAWLTTFLFAGMIASSLLVGYFGRHWPRGKTIIWGMVFDAVTFLPLFWLRRFWPAVLAMFVHGLTVPLITVPRATLIHHIVPDDKRGRVFALVNLAVVGFTALSMLLVGPVIELVGAAEVFAWVAGVGGAFGLVALGFRSLRRA